MDVNDNNILTRKISLIAYWIATSKHLVVFTGAGISTASGIPDFRGPEGVWTRRDKGLPPPKMKKAWSEVKPNIGHNILVELQNMALLKCLITQNTDNLHLESGIIPEILSELHGNGNYVECLSCETRITYEKAHWEKSKWGPGYRTSSVRLGQPVCPNCKGRLISTIVNFGDSLPERDYSLAQKHTEQADVFLVVGSSCVVTPAADLPKIAMKNNAKTIIINKGETPLDDDVSIKIEEDITQTLSKIFSEIEVLLRN